MTDDRATRGAETLKKVHAEWGMPNVLSKLDDIAPDLKNMVRDFAFGEVYSRPGLDIKSRQLATVAVLAALQHSPLELKAHLHGALKLGWTKTELVEVLMQQVLYAGFPAAIHAVMSAKEVFEEYDSKSKGAKEAK